MRTKEMIDGIPEFYKEVLRAWKSYLPNVTLDTERREDYLRQPLF